MPWLRASLDRLGVRVSGAISGFNDDDAQEVAGSWSSTVVDRGREQCFDAGIIERGEMEGHMAEARASRRPRRSTLTLDTATLVQYPTLTVIKPPIFVETQDYYCYCYSCRKAGRYR